MGGKKVFELMLEIGHKSTPLKHKLTNGYTHKWTAFVKGVDNSKIENCIQRVVFQLHESFPNSYREVTEPPFQVKETGYAGFEIPIQIYFKNRDKPNHLVFVHDLSLLTNKPNNTTTTEKIKFIHPNKEFEKCLIKSGAQLLTVPVKKERSDSPPAKKQKSSSLIPSKDMSKQSTQQSLPQSQPQSQPQPTQHQKSSQHNQNHHHHSSGSGSSHHKNHQKHQHHKQQTELNQNHRQQQQHHQQKEQPQQLQHQPQKEQQQSQLPQQPAQKPSRDFMDVFGAPILYNTSTKEERNKEERFKEERYKEERNKEERNKEERIKEERIKEERIKEERIKEERIKEERIKEERIKEERNKEERNREERNREERNREERNREERNREERNREERYKEERYKEERHKEERNREERYKDLNWMKTKIRCLTDCDRLQKIVDIVEESGEWFNLTPKKFEFDLKRLDKKTLIRIERCLQH